MPSLYEWLNREKARYYRVTILKDMNNDIILNYKWGGLTTKRGGKKNIRVQTQEEVQSYITKMMKRRKSRGYELIAPSIN